MTIKDQADKVASDAVDRVMANRSLIKTLLDEIRIAYLQGRVDAIEDIDLAVKEAKHD